MNIKYRLDIRNGYDLNVIEFKNIVFYANVFGDYLDGQKLFDMTNLNNMLYFINGNCKIGEIKFGVLFLKGKGNLPIKSVGSNYIYGIQTMIK